MFRITEFIAYESIFSGIPLAWWVLFFLRCADRFWGLPRFRSHLAVRILKENGWTDVRNPAGGWIAATALGGFAVESA